MTGFAAFATSKDSMIHLISLRYPFDTLCGVDLGRQLISRTERPVDCMACLIRESRR